MSLLHKPFTLFLLVLLLVLPSLALPNPASGTPTVPEPLFTPGQAPGADIPNAPKTISPDDVIPGPEFLTLTVINHTPHPSAPSTPAQPTRLPSEAATSPRRHGARRDSELCRADRVSGPSLCCRRRGVRGFYGDESLIEANYVVAGGYTVAVADVDVCYVDGFSVPITCQCEGVGVVTGCNKNLWDSGPCPHDNGHGSRVSPLRADKAATQADPFFRPCQGLAYTFVEVHKGNSFGVCQKGISCCIGIDCPSHP